MSQTQLIGLVVMLIVTAGGIAVLYDVNRDTGHRSMVQNTQREAQSGGQGGVPDLEIVNAVGSDIQDDGVKYVRFQVRYEGEGELDINETFVQLRTDKSVTDLQYRNGTLNRSVSTGFYTQ